MVVLLTWMEVTTKVNGRMIVWMVLVSYTTLMELQHMRVIGYKMSSMVQAVCIMISLRMKIQLRR